LGLAATFQFADGAAGAARSMTDDEAVLKLMLMRVTFGDKFAAALEHLATALADRKALVTDYDSEIGIKVSTMEAARLHMEGKK
jgi:hypothetical protein